MASLDSIQDPSDLKGLSLDELAQIADQIRAEMIDVVTHNGGHLGAGLGAVELTLALHYVLDSPNDLLVWDVGHQAYPHKLLTGRQDRFPTIRQEGGLSGFLSRDESIHDAFGAGHASTAISAALGMAVAKRLQDPKDDDRVVAIIGDGALTGGMAFEGLNNAGNLDIPFIVVLNDNEMSIAPNVGAMSKYLDRVRTDPRYTRGRDDVQSVLERLPQGDLLVELGKRWKDSLKEFVYHRMMWEELGFTYLGPVAGHDIRQLVPAIRQAQRIDGPVFLHVVTEKGKGFPAAANDVERSHAVSAPPKPAAEGAPPAPPKYQDVFAATLIELAKTDDSIVGITAAMPTGTSLHKFQKAFPKRFFDVGIAEQHAVTFAAGLATQGIKPVCAIYSTFLQRAFDQVLHDVCLQKLPVIFAIDRAGFAGDDGRTHHGIYDLSYLRCLPNMTLMAPRDENQLRHMLATAMTVTGGPVALRYPRGVGLGVPTDEEIHTLPIGKGELLRDGNDVAILAVGSMVDVASRAAAELALDGIQAAVFDAQFIKPLDRDAIVELANRCGAIVTIEENTILGGFGAGVLELLSDEGIDIPIRHVGVPDRVFEQASQARLREIAGLTPTGVIEAVRQVLRARPTITATSEMIQTH
jgi:1-deoxy-D-xylulose-5-phosphate synthase